jgi:hypothetical protein
MANAIISGAFDPFRIITDFRFGGEAEWIMSVLLRCPLDPRLMEGTLTGPYSGDGIQLADEGVRLDGTFSEEEGEWIYHIDDFIEYPGGLPGAERYTIEVTVTLLLMSDPTNFFLGQLNGSNFPTDAPHGGGIVVNTVARSVYIDGFNVTIFDSMG